MKYLDILKNKYNSWSELELEIEKLPTTKLMGDAFEQFCYLYFIIKIPLNVHFINSFYILYHIN